MTANFARSICLAAYLTLAACASAPTPNPAPSAKAPAPAVERRQPAPPKTNTDATFALLSEADIALDAAQPKRAILLLERAVRIEPRNFELWIRLSRAHLATDNMNAALQHARKAFSIASPDRMMETPQSLLQNVTPLYWSPVGVRTTCSLNGKCPNPCSTTRRMMRSL